MKFTSTNIVATLVCWISVVGKRRYGLDGAADTFILLGAFSLILIPLGIMALIESKGIENKKLKRSLVVTQSLALLCIIAMAPMSVTLFLSKIAT